VLPVRLGCPHADVRQAIPTPNFSHLPLPPVTTPRLEDARSAEHGVRITCEGIELFDRLPELLLGGEAICEDGVGDVFQGDTN
jgi:hypothetical protein